MTPDFASTPFAASTSEADALYQSGALADYLQQEREHFLTSPDWTTPRLLHLALLVESVSFGILSADFWFRGYRVPPGLETVLNWMAFNIQREWGPETFALLTLANVEAQFRAWLEDCPQVKEWNPAPTRNDATRRFYLALKNAEDGEGMASRPFVEIESVCRQAAVFLNQHWETRLRVNQRLQPIALGTEDGPPPTP